MEVADDAGDVTMMTPTSTMLTTLAIITTIIKIIIAISIASIESALHLTRVGTWTLPAFPGSDAAGAWPLRCKICQFESSSKDV